MLSRWRWASIPLSLLVLGLTLPNMYVGAVVRRPLVELRLPANVQPDPNFPVLCQAAPERHAACEDAIVAAINHARRLEHVGPMILPRDFNQDTPAEQLFIVINLERVARHLPPAGALWSQLDTLSATAAANDQDPVWEPSGYFGAYDAGSNWAQGLPGVPTPSAVNVLGMDYGWMYEDGPGPSEWHNVGCPRAGAAGCWGHRRNILLDQPAYGSTFQMGAGYSHSPEGPSGALVLIESTMPLPGLGHPVYTWADAVKSGAGRARQVGPAR